ncbi:hypothetical protein ACJJTC_006630 [Scirpophaga incertulas]
MTSENVVFVRSDILSKTNHTLNYVARNTSCSRGWLRLVVQIIFGAITVTSFVLIILMALRKPPPPKFKLPCVTQSCSITCSGTYHDNDILAAMMAVEETCDEVRVTLNTPHFPQGVMPENWLNIIPMNVYSLTILGGNLVHISPNAFISRFTTQLSSLRIENVTLSSLSSSTFAGLSKLKMINIVNTHIENIEENCLSSIQKTLKIAFITSSGEWDPKFVTGAIAGLSNLTIVDFSGNIFGRILGPSSFSALGKCENLNLNSNEINFIVSGTFDPLRNIKELHLNNNFLTSISPGLFRNMMSLNPKPRIDLSNNLLVCDCLQEELLRLHENGMMLFDPICYQPQEIIGINLSTIANSCVINNKNKRIVTNVIDFDVMNKCHYGERRIPHLPLQLISPTAQFQCSIGDAKNLDKIELHNADKVLNDSWLKPSFIFINRHVSMMQVGSSPDTKNRGFIWFQSECPNEIYCFNTMPAFLTLYNINVEARYTFCPIDMSYSLVEIDHCVYYNITQELIKDPESKNNFLRPLLYILTGFLSLLGGAITVYGLIRLNPHLLKGSKRLLFVKHKTVDALVLPPKIPLRTSLQSEDVCGSGNTDVYTITDEKLLQPANVLFMRSNSVRSDKSNTPTYVSALQPTEAQLAEWRIRHHFDKSASIISITSDASWITTNIYDTVTYESIK